MTLKVNEITEVIGIAAILWAVCHFLLVVCRVYSNNDSGILHRFRDHIYTQWRNSGLKSEGDQAKFLTWCIYKVGVVLPLQKVGVRTPFPLKLRLCVQCPSAYNIEKFFSFEQTIEITSHVCFPIQV